MRCTVKRMKTPAIDWKKIFAEDIFGNGWGCTSG
jgi:hypothetical protein